MSRIVLVVSLLWLSAASFALAENASIRGEVLDASGPVDRLTVYLTSVERGSTSEKAFVSPGGSFQFASIAQGNYVLEVRNIQGDVIAQRMISVMGGPLETSISLRNISGSPQRGTASGSPTVSVNQLRHDPDGHAVREFLIGEKALLKQDLPRARKYFMKALELDPDYPEAHIELGSTAFRSGRLDEAKLEFKRALELDPKQPMAWGNLAALLYQNKEYDRAEETARDGIRNVPNDPKLHFVLGAARMAKGQYTGDTARHLDLALTDFPNAHVLLAETLLRLGELSRAKPHLEASLASENSKVRARAEFLIREVNKIK
jgi:hypothetical protein